MEKWLADKDLLVSTRSFKPTMAGVAKEKLKRVLPLFMKDALKSLLPKKVTQDTTLNLNHLDMTRTKVFTVGGYGQLIINLKGRQPNGIVESGREYDELCGQLIESLKELRDPDSGEKIIADAQMRDDVYSEYQENTPDIIVRWARGYYHIGERELQFLGIKVRGDQLFTPHRWSGNHQPDGIFVLSGRNVRSAGMIQGARIIDLAPTILALLGVGIPKDMDGIALLTTISEDFLATNEMSYCEASDEDVRTEKVYSEEERQKVSERLRDLGYLE